MPSQWEYIKQGNVKAAVINILRTATEISSFSGGAPTVSGSYVGYDFDDDTKNRWIRVSREGGNIIWPNIDKPRIDIDVLAERQSVADDLAQVAQAVIFRAMGQAFPTYGVVISDVKVETGITQVPDRETGAPRNIFALRLTCVPSQ